MLQKPIPIRIALLALVAIVVLIATDLLVGPGIIRRAIGVADRALNPSAATSSTADAPAATAPPATALAATAVAAPATANAPASALPIAGAAPLASAAIFSDTLASDWQNWSWGSAIDLASTTARSSTAIGVTYTEGWSALYLHTDKAIKTRDFDTLRFWINGGASGGQQIRLCSSNECKQPSDTITLVANTWTQIDVPLSKIGATTSLDELLWQNATPESQSPLFIDDIALVATNQATLAASTAVQPGPALTLDASAKRFPISPLIYGINFPDAALAQELKLPIQRWGGNATTRYNWQNDSANRAADWFFENIPNDVADAAALPNGSSADMFVEQAKRTGSAALMTIPMTGWTPKSREITCGFPSDQFPDQQQTDPYRPCGNGLKADGTPLTGNDPKNTSIAIDEQFVKDWIAHLQRQFGSASSGGVGYFNLDNEPFLWHTTHRDVWPNPLSYDQLRDLTYRYAAAVKQADQAAQTLGPAEWGWTGYFYSAKDSAEGGKWWDKSPDRKAHGDTPFAAWYLQQMQAYEKQNGVRILDFFDLHYYPQAQGVALQGAGNDETQAVRLRSTRALWDASYKDESWINESVKLIPRMHEWVEQNYPGTKLAMTEYNFGALDDMNGALAQADVLGIFGRERLDLATLWAGLGNQDPWAYAFRMYRNYDGQGSQFGETSLQAASVDQDTLAIYAAERADGALTIMVINKSDTNLSSALSITGAQATQASVYRYSTANLKQISKEADIAVANGGISASYPASSITLLVLK